MIKLRYNEETIETEFFTFPDGTRHVKVKGDFNVKEYNNAEIWAQVSSSDDIIDILLLKDAVDRQVPIQDFFLYIPYMLGSRQDRVMIPGEPLSIQVYANMINSCNFTQVAVLDAHSVATIASLNSGQELGVVEYFYDEFYINPENAVVVSPDAGAVKRATDFAKAKGIDTLVKADKTRDLATGKITDFNLYATATDIFGKDIYIVDDIVTNGGTFLGLLEAISIYDPKSVNLVITHADHYEGLFNMSVNFDNVYVTNSRERKWVPGVIIVDIFDGEMD